MVTPKQGSQRAHRGQGCLRKGESFRGPFTRWEGADGPEEMGKLRQSRAVTVRVGSAAIAKSLRRAA